MDTLTLTYRLIAKRELSKMMERGERFHLWLVLASRPGPTNECIPGSRRFLLETLLRRPAPAEKGEAVVLYGASPRCTLAKQAAERLKSDGYRQVAVYEGGLEDWRDAGLPLEALGREKQPAPARMPDRAPLGCRAAA